MIQVRHEPDRFTLLDLNLTEKHKESMYNKSETNVY